MDDRTHPQPIIVSVRKDPMLVVRQLIKQCPVGSFQKFAKPAYKNGSRCYNEFWTAQKWERVQVSLVLYNLNAYMLYGLYRVGRLLQGSCCRLCMIGSWHTVSFGPSMCCTWWHLSNAVISYVPGRMW